jgi:hypothetical protein
VPKPTGLTAPTPSIPPTSSGTPDPRLDPKAVRIGTLSPSEVAEVIEALDRLRAEERGQNRRAAARVGCVDLERVALVVNPDRADTRKVFAVAPVDLSTGGVCLLHTAMIFPETNVAVVLQTLSGEFAAVGGTVRRCRYLANRIHEVAIRFSQPIELSRFIALDDPAEPGPDAQTGATPPAQPASATDAPGVAPAPEASVPAPPAQAA